MEVPTVDCQYKKFSFFNILTLCHALYFYIEIKRLQIQTFPLSGINMIMHKKFSCIINTRATSFKTTLIIIHCTIFLKSRLLTSIKFNKNSYAKCNFHLMSVFHCYSCHGPLSYVNLSRLNLKLDNPFNLQVLQCTVCCNLGKIVIINKRKEKEKQNTVIKVITLNMIIIIALKFTICKAMMLISHSLQGDVLSCPG